MAKKKNPGSQQQPLKRPTATQLRLAGHHCRQRARRHDESAPLDWMELGTLLDTTDAHRAVDVIWQAFTIGYPAGGQGSGASTEPSSSTERAALRNEAPAVNDDDNDPELKPTTSRKKVRERSDPAAINLQLIARLVDALENYNPERTDAAFAPRIDSNNARTLVIGLRGAINHPGRTGIACPDCGHIVDAKRRKCWRNDCPSNAPDRTCTECGDEVPEGEQMTKGMHKRCYDRTRRATVEDNRGTTTRDIHDTTGMTSTEDAA